MIDGAQRIAEALGKWGCYFLSLCYIAEETRGVHVDPIDEAAQAMKIRAVDGRMILGANCFINDAGAAFSLLTGERFGVLKAGPGHTIALTYTPQPGEREILRFERPNPEGGEPLAHFVVGDGSGRVAWDPWPGSETVRSGHLVSKRIIRRFS